MVFWLVSAVTLVMVTSTVSSHPKRSPKRLPSLSRVCSNSIPAIILFSDKEKEIAEGVVHRMVKRAVEMEGTVTGEHGVGLVKRDYLAHELGESTVDAMRRVSLKQNADSVISTSQN